MNTSEKTKKRIEIMDTTLRDGEQTHGVSISVEEKLTVARTLLERVKVDRIEVASAGVSEGEKRAVSVITSWAKKAGYGDRIEVLGFCNVNKSADWIGEAGGAVMNLLTKGSHRHLEGQLRKSPSQHIADIAKTVEYAGRHGIACNVYPEDWSGGMLEKHEYARTFIGELAAMPIKRIMLADTLGLLPPDLVIRFVRELAEKYPNTHFDFHGHNDYGLATANCLAAVQAGARGVHVTVNGLGERAGNAPLDEVSVVLKDIAEASHGVDESELFAVSKMVEIFSGKRVAANKPVSGSAVFTQTAGIHADGDKKGNLYITKLSPERFKRSRTYALGKLSGKASLDMNLDKLGLELTTEQRDQVLSRVIELGDQKQMITPDELPFIIADVLKSPKHQVIAISDCIIATAKHLPPTATIAVVYDGKTHHASAVGDGGYDAFMKALISILANFGLSIPKLIDYEVHIPPGGKTDALVEATIVWEGGVITRGVDSDQVKAAIVATENMLNIVLKPDAGKKKK